MLASSASFAVAEEAGVVVVYLAVLEVLPVAPLDAAAEGLAFRLSLAHHKGEDHLVVHVEGVDIMPHIIVPRFCGSHAVTFGQSAFKSNFCMRV